MYTPVFASKRKNPHVRTYAYNARKGVQKIEISQKRGCEKSVHLFTAMGVKNVYTSVQYYISQGERLLK